MKRLIQRPRRGVSETGVAHRPETWNRLTTTAVAAWLVATAYVLVRGASKGTSDEVAQEEGISGESGEDANAPESGGIQADTDFVGEERSEEELRERGVPDVQVEPAEPGEMNVDESVIEDVVDDDDDDDTGDDNDDSDGATER